MTEYFLLLLQTLGLGFLYLLIAVPIAYAFGRFVDAGAVDMPDIDDRHELEERL